MTLLPVTPGRPAPSAADLAWLALIPTTAPNLSAVERGRIAALRTMATEDRVRARCDALLAT